jgi:pimeloyl-ACP methyl ester carboxylesterase
MCGSFCLRVVTEAGVLDLAVRNWGTGSKRALLLHGIASSAAGWWRLGPDLAAIGYSVLAPDLRGHGSSPKGHEMRLEDYARDVTELGDGWDLVVAHSLGGAIVLAGRLGYIALTRRLVLQDPAILGRSEPDVIAWLLGEFEGVITPESVASANPTWHSKDAAFKAEAMQQCGPEAIHRTMQDSGSWNLWDELMAVDVPTLLIGADPALGALVPPAMGAAAMDGNPHIRYETVAGGSHSMHRNEYERYWGLIEDFITG